jgi:hypothetical protein
MLCKLTRSYVCHATFRRKFLVSPPLPSPPLCRLQLPSPFLFRATTASPQQRSRGGPFPPPHQPHPTTRHYTTSPPPHPDKTRSGRAAQGQTRGAVWSSTGRCATTVPQSVSAPSEEHRFRFRLAVAPTCDSLSRRRRPQPLCSCSALAPGRVREHPSDWGPCLFCSRVLLRFSHYCCFPLPNQLRRD